MTCFQTRTSFKSRSWHQYVHDDGSMIFSCPETLSFRVLHENKFPGSFLQLRANMATSDASRSCFHMLKRVIRPKNDFEESAANEGGNCPIIRVPFPGGIWVTGQVEWSFHPWLTPSIETIHDLSSPNHTTTIWCQNPSLSFEDGLSM